MAGDNDPIMPMRPPLAALRAIQQIMAYRTWTAVEMYDAIREALQKTHEYPAARRDAGIGRTARPGIGPARITVSASLISRGTITPRGWPRSRRTVG